MKAVQARATELAKMLREKVAELLRQKNDSDQEIGALKSKATELEKQISDLNPEKPEPEKKSKSKKRGRANK